MKPPCLRTTCCWPAAHDVMVAGGMESMTNAPYLLQKGRGGYRMGHDRIFDHMMLDGLEDAYEPGRSMGTFGEDCAAKYSFTRAEQDAFATASVQRAKAATSLGRLCRRDHPRHGQGPRWAKPWSPWTKARARSSSTRSPRSSPPSRRTAPSPPLQLQHQRRRRRPGDDARIHRHQAGLQAAGAHRGPRHARAGARVVCHRPVGATQKALAKAGWSVGDVDLWEINEAFAVVPMALMKELNLPHDKVNVNGGACALGHPIGASGARIMVTLIYALQARGLKKGLATLCIGGGEATAVALELSLIGAIDSGSAAPPLHAFHRGCWMVVFLFKYCASHEATVKCHRRLARHGPGTGAPVCRGRRRASSPPRAMPAGRRAAGAGVPRV
jgi:acetyl-CoA C-acetyltransferase